MSRDVSHYLGQLAFDVPAQVTEHEADAVGQAGGTGDLSRRQQCRRIVHGAEQL